MFLNISHQAFKIIVLSRYFYAEWVKACIRKFIDSVLLNRMVAKMIYLIWYYY